MLSKTTSRHDLRSALQPCQNCGRPANSELSGVGAVGGGEDHDGVFCSQNCFWSETLDLSKSRLRNKKRAGRSAHRRARARARPHVAETGAILIASDTSSDDAAADAAFPFPAAADDAPLALYAFCLSGVQGVDR
jgi:hypothetical protein